MMKSIIAVLFAIVAFAAQSEAAAYCRHSAYQLPCAIPLAAKKAMFASCGFTVLKNNKAKLGPREVFISGYKYFSSNKCCQIRQRVASANTWNNVYKGCEESHAKYLNPNGNFGSLKGTKGACAFLAFSGSCK